MTTETHSQANIDRFNEIAANWDDKPGRVNMAQSVARTIAAHIPEAGGGNALEFGCGTGLVTAMLAPQCARVVAMDSSEGMLQVLKGKIDELSLTNVETLEGDLSKTLPEGPFDLIFSSMTLHHIEDVQGLASRLNGILKPGGQIALADLEAEDGSFHGDMPGIAHHGFKRDVLTGWLEAAGFENIRFEHAYTMNKAGDDGVERQFPIFLVTARKP